MQGERKKPKSCEFLVKFAIRVIWDLYMEKKANRGPGFQSFCLEFATHVMKQGISMVKKEDTGSGLFFEF